MSDFQTRQWEKGHKLLADDMNDFEGRIATGFASVEGGGTPTQPTTPAFGDPVGQPADVWTPVFGDDFDGSLQVIDADNGVVQFGDGPKWSSWYKGDVTDDGGHTNNGAKGLGYYMNEGLGQAGSSALLKAIYQPNASRPDHPYITGMLQSIDFTPVHGYFEARVKYSGVQGTWPAVWLTAVDTWPPEIDILEQYGQVRDNKITTWQNDVPAAPGTLNGQYISSTPQDTWIVVACEWDADKIVFYYDGVEVARETVRGNVPDRPMYLMLDMQIDADQAGTNPAQYPTAFEVDYYRAWKKVEPTQVYFQDEFEGAAGTALDPAKWLVGESGANGQGTAVLNGDGSFSIAPNPGAWALGPGVYATGMDNVLDFDVYIDFDISSLEEHYPTFTVRSNGTINGGSNSPNNAYGVAIVPQTGKFELSRFNWSGGGDSMGIGSYPWVVGEKATMRFWLNGGQAKIKVFKAGEEEPEDWELEVTLGIDKAMPVIIDPGKLLLSSLNGGNGNSHPIRIHRVVVNKAVQPDPVLYTGDNPDDDGDGGTTPVKTTRYGAYTLGGATAVDNAGSSVGTNRIPVNLPKKAKRIRLHVTNRQGLNDYNMPNGPQVLRATLGKKDNTPGAGYLAVESVQAFPAGTGSLDDGGEWISGWLTPSFETDNYAWLSVAGQFTGTDIAATYSGGGWWGDGGDMTNELSSNGWTNYGTTPFNMYLEYEYEDDGQPQVLFLGDSIPEGYTDGGSKFGQNGMRNFAGHIDSFPEAYGRHTGRVATANCYASARIDMFNTNSPKWNRFSQMAEQFAPDAIVIHLGGNDFFQSEPWADVVTEMEQWLYVVKAKFPKARIFLMGCIPLLAANAAGFPPFNERVYMNTGFATMPRALLDGYIEPDNGLYDPTSGESENIRSKYVSADGLHLTPQAYEILAAAIQI